MQLYVCANTTKHRARRDDIYNWESYCSDTLGYIKASPCTTLIPRPYSYADRRSFIRHGLALFTCPCEPGCCGIAYVIFKGDRACHLYLKHNHRANNKVQHGIVLKYLLIYFTQK
jgi:hypothetical protein